MNIKTESLLAAATEKVGRKLHGDQGKRNPWAYLKRAEPIIERSIVADSEGLELRQLENWLIDDPGILKKSKLDRYLDISLEIYRASEQESSVSAVHFGVPGHDMENVIHTTTEVLRMIEAASSGFGDYAKWELLISGLNENLGRLDEGDDFSHDTTGFLLAREALKILEVGLDERPAEDEKLIAKRVMGNIYSHGGRNSGDPVSDLVRQSNRLQQVEPRLLRRSIEYDIAQVDQNIISPIDPERRTSMSFLTNEKPEKLPTLMDWGEFFARNLFPFISDDNTDNPDLFKKIMNENQKVADDRRANNIAMLVILAGGENTELFKQVFAPELELINPSDVHWTKRRIPEQIFQAGLQKYREFIQNPPDFPGLEGMDDKIQIAAILEAMSSYLPKDLLEKIYKKYDELDENEQERVVDALHHSLYLHYKELDKEIAMLERQINDSNPHVAKVARFAKNYLELKNRLDKPKEPEGEF